MKDFLSKFMRRNRDPDKQFIGKHEDAFITTCEVLVTKLGEKPFHVRAGLNVAVFEAVIIAFAKHLNSIPKDISIRYSRLLENDEFRKLTSGATTDKLVVVKRLELTEKILFG